MGIITGYVCLICFILLGSKYVARRLQWKRANRIIMIVHKYIAFLFLMMIIIHFVLVLPVLGTRMAVITVSGIIAFMSAVMLTIICHVLKDREKEIKFHRAFSIGILIMTVVHIIFYFVDFRNYQQKIATANVQNVNLEEICDGQYLGEYDAGYVMASVRVTVKNHSIVDVELLEHKNERGSRAEEIINLMVEDQCINVDVVSGATNSSTVIMKACENALRGGE